MILTNCFKGVQLDFNKFAFYQCALCLKKHSKLKELKEHVENHLRFDTFFHFDGETFVSNKETLIKIEIKSLEGTFLQFLSEKLCQSICIKNTYDDPYW